MLQITSECYKKPGDNVSVTSFLVENHHNLQAEMEHFLHRLKLYPRGFLKEIHSLVRDGTTGSKLKHIKQNQQTQND